MSLRRVGVEEELLLVEPGMGRPRAVAGTVLHAARQVATGPGRDPDAGRLAGDGAQALDFELQLQQLETNTQPRRAVEELGREVRRCRALAAEAPGRGCLTGVTDAGRVAFTSLRVSSRDGRALPRGRGLCDGLVPAASLIRVPGMGPAGRLAMSKAGTGSRSPVLEEAARELEAAA